MEPLISCLSWRMVDWTRFSDIIFFRLIISMDKPELTLEFPASDNPISFTDPSMRDGAIDYLLWTLIPDNYGEKVTIHPVPYDGEPGLLQGGRDNPPSLDNLLDTIDAFNKRGVPFAVAMNGGRSLPKDFNFDVFRNPGLGHEYLLLDRLANNGPRYGVQNRVILTRRELLHVIAEYFPTVETVCSAVTFMGGRKGEFRGITEYEDAFENFDYVCPPNQHATPDFLGTYREHVKKMVLIIGANCGSTDFRTCHWHHAQEEHQPLIIQPEDFVFIPSQLPKETRGCMVDGDNCSTASLEFRTSDLKTLMEMGVDQFKLPRNLSSIWHGHTVLTLANMFADVQERVAKFGAEAPH